MNEVVIVADSSASIPETIRAELDIHLVPIYIHHGDKVWRDLVDISRKDFYRWLPTVDKLPTTATPGPGDFLNIYESLHARGAKQILSFHVSSKSSGTFQTATLAAEMAAENHPDLEVVPVDTLNVAMCHGWMAIEAARAARLGAGLEQILALVRRMIPVTRMIQTADTLKYLHMGGRIGNAAHMMGSLLRIKPLIGMENGVITALGRERTLNRTYQRIVKMVTDDVGVDAKIKVAYLHAAAGGLVGRLQELLESKVTCVESLVAELAPSLGVHSGPGTTGICYFPAAALDA